MNPLITVIVPVYNVEDYLIRCVDSILKQTYRNLEIILIDDGSPDKCGEICDSYLSQDSRIKVIHKVNGGLSDARNTGIDSATGEYLMFIDSDDFLREQSIEILYNLVKLNNADIAVGQFKYYKTIADINLNQKKKTETLLSGYNALITMFYQDKFENSACCKLYHRHLFETRRFPIGLLYEDLATTHKLIEEAKSVIITDEVIYYYFIRENSIMGEKFSEKNLDILLIGDSLIKEYESKGKEMMFALKCRLISAYLNILLRMEKDNTYINLFWERIKLYRWDVLKDINGRKKTRIACLISYFGLNTVRFFFSIIRNR